MKHMTEAYEALVEQLKADFKREYDDYETRLERARAIQDVLTVQLVKHGGKEAAMEAGRLIDQRFKVGFEEWVDDTF